MQTFLLGTLENARHSVDTHVEALKWRSERETDEVMARRREKVTAVCRVDVKEDTGNDNALFFE